MEKTKTRWLVWLFFAVYCLILLRIAFYRFSPADWRAGTMDVTGEINLIPFVGMFNDFQNVSPTVTYYNIVGNAAIFLPLGVFLQILHRDKRVRSSLLTVLLTTLAVETVQLITGFGVFDVDDLILNFLGGALGIGACRLLHRLAGGE